jgi:hypothetical protein
MLERIALATAVAAAIAASPALARDDDFESFGWALASRVSTVATSTDDLSQLDEWTSEGERVLFVRFGSELYLIHDPATLDRVDRLVKPIRELGEKAREIIEMRGTELSGKLGKREWKERLRPYKEKRRELLLGVSDEIESLAREAVQRGKAERLD